MGHRISLMQANLEAGFAHLATDTVPAAELADRYREAMFDAGTIVDNDDLISEVPVTPAEIVEVLDDVVDDDEGALGRDWGTAFIAVLADGRVCAFGMESRCGDGCCPNGVWHVAATRDELPSPLFYR